MTKPLFNKGDQVTKFSGDYWFDGEVRSVMTKKSGAVRYDVENDAGQIHIFGESQLRHVGNWADHQYLRIMDKILKRGVKRAGRNGHHTYGLFGEQMRFDLSDGFPLLTTKRLHLKSIVAELLWFIRGDTNIKFLHDHGVTIWDEWADNDGNLGPVYGKQWRSWPTGQNAPRVDRDGHTWHNPVVIDQLANVIAGIKKDPHGRRHIVSAWNPAEIDQMALPPCHTMFQFHVAEGKLSCHLYQRSADWFLGVPYNVASYALLTELVARECGLAVGDFVHSFGDVHLYSNHVDQAQLQLTRQPMALPVLDLTGCKDKRLEEIEPADIRVDDYEYHPAIKAEVAV